MDSASEYLSLETYQYSSFENLLVRTQAHDDTVGEAFAVVYKIIWVVAEVPEELRSFGILKMMVTFFTNSFVEKLMVKSPTLSPSRIRIKEHKMVIVHNKVISNVKFRPVTIDS